MTIYSLFQPRYSTDVAGRAVESDSILELIREGASTELDYEALNVFIRFGTFIGADTAFKSIRFTPPPSIESLGLRNIELPREQILDAYIDLFRQSVCRCLQASSGRSLKMGLSAGRDSRHILLELHRQRVDPNLCWTLDFPGESDAVAIASELTSRLGVAHTAIQVSQRDFVTREMRKNESTSFSSLQHGGTVPALGVIGPDDVLYDGIGGDVLSAGLFLTKERVALVESGRTDEFIDQIVSRGSYRFLTAAPLLSRDVALDRVSKEFRRHLSAPDPISSFYCWTRTRRDIGASAFSLLRPQRQTIIAPYLDDDLFRFFSGLPARITVDHQLHTDAIARAYPEFAAIAYGQKNEVPSSVHRTEVLMTMRRLCTRPARMLVLHRLATAMARTFVSRRHASDTFWLSRMAIYFNGLSDLLRGTV